MFKILKYLSVIVLSMGLLISCDNTSNQKSIHGKTFDVTEYRVEYEVVDSFKEIDARYTEIWNMQQNVDPTKEKLKLKYDKAAKHKKITLMGFTYHRGTTCVVVMGNATIYKNDGEFEQILGHENRHCIFGSFHKMFGAG